MATYNVLNQCDGCDSYDLLNAPADQLHRVLRTLPCFHTVCTICVMKNTRERQITCPHNGCKKLYTIQDIDQPVRCKMCKIPGCMSVSRCVDCGNIELCIDCELSHAKKEQDHQINPVPQFFMDSVKEEMRSLHMEMEREKLKMRRARSLAAGTDSTARQEEEDKLALERADKAFMSKLNEQMPGLVNTTKMQLGGIRPDMQGNLHLDKEVMVRDLVRNTENQFSFMSDIIDDRMRQNMNNSVSQLVREGLTQVEDLLATCGDDNNMTFEVAVTGKPFDPLAIPEVQVKTVLTPKINFSKISENLYVQKHSADIEGCARRIYIVKKEVWVTTWNACHVFDKQCRPLRSIYFDNRYEISSAIPIETDFILACDYERGLFLFNDKADQILQYISPGNFSDVEIYKDKFYALDYEIGIVIQVEVFNHIWRVTRRIKLTYDNISSGDTFRVTKDMLYVASAQNHTIYKYNTLGKKLLQVGQYSKTLSVYGALFYPRYCVLDNHGHSLIADSWNKRLRVLLDNNKWRPVNIKGNPGEIWDASIEDSAENMWLISCFDGDYKLIHVAALVV